MTVDRRAKEAKDLGEGLDPGADFTFHAELQLVASFLEVWQAAMRLAPVEGEVSATLADSLHLLVIRNLDLLLDIAADAGNDC